MQFFINLLPTIITGLFLFYWQRAQKKHDDIKEDVEKVNREVNSATMELAYATAIAVERGKTNGELKKAKEAYDKATKDQRELIIKLSQKN